MMRKDELIFNVGVSPTIVFNYMIAHTICETL